MTRLLLVTSLVTAFAVSAHAETFAYVGTFERGPYVCTFDEETGVLGQPRKAADLANPSFVAVSPDARTLYVIAYAPESSVVVAMRIEDDGSLTKQNELPLGGPGGCHVSVSPDARCVMAVSFSDGAVAAFTVNADGSLGERGTLLQHEGGSGVARMQDKAHPHAINASPDGRHAYVTDLGQDRVAIYDLDTKTAKLTPSEPTEVKTPPGGGPRHMTIHPDGKLAAVNLELTAQVILYAIDAETGGLTQLDIKSTLPGDRAGEKNSTAECLFAGDGSTVLVTNRFTNLLASLSVDSAGLTPVSVERVDAVPRGMGVSPNGRYAVTAARDDGTLQVFEVTFGGDLVPVKSDEPPVTVPKPVNVRFVRR